MVRLWPKPALADVPTYRRRDGGMKVWVRPDWVPIVVLPPISAPLEWTCWKRRRSSGELRLRVPCQARGRTEDSSNGMGTCREHVRDLRWSWKVSPSLVCRSTQPRLRGWQRGQRGISSGCGIPHPELPTGLVHSSCSGGSVGTAIEQGHPLGCKVTAALRLTQPVQSRNHRSSPLALLASAVSVAPDFLVLSRDRTRRPCATTSEYRKQNVPGPFELNWGRLVWTFPPALPTLNATRRERAPPH